jgi:hypothetical protein
MIGGNIRVDVEVTGDIETDINNLISIKYLPPSPIEPGRSLLVPLDIFSGRLKRLLQTHPQASLKMNFTVYIDPVINQDGKLTNRLTDIPPASLSLTRPAVNITTKHLQNRFDSLAQGRQGQKIRTGELFTGLLAEQAAAADKKLPYRLKYADWMTDMLKEGIVHNLSSDDWILKTHNTCSLLPLPLDYELINAVSKNLSDEAAWPVRLISLYLLAQKDTGDFNKVINWAAKYDQHKLVRSMAVGLGAQTDQQQQADNN